MQVVAITNCFPKQIDNEVISLIYSIFKEKKIQTKN